MHIRDVNSREIAFPGRESQFPGLSRLSISPECIPFTVHADTEGLTEIAGLDIDGRVKKRGWTLQDWTLTDWTITD